MKVLLVFLALVAWVMAVIPGPLVLRLDSATTLGYNPTMFRTEVAPWTFELAEANTTAYDVVDECWDGVGRFAFPKHLTLEGEDTQQNVFPFRTFAWLYNLKGHLTGYVNILINYDEYEYPHGQTYFVRIEPNTPGPLDLPIPQWIHVVVFEENSVICTEDSSTPSTSRVGSGNLIKLNGFQLETYPNQIVRVEPQTKQEARAQQFFHPPTGDECTPFMGSHWSKAREGRPIFNEIVDGMSSDGNSQFIELIVPVKQPAAEYWWDFNPAGTHPAFSDDTWTRHIHHRPLELACINVCGISDECHPDATCSYDFILNMLPPFYTCTCPNDPTILKLNGGLGPNGCYTCPQGTIANPTRDYCVNPCGARRFPDPETGNCVDINECEEEAVACAADEFCYNRVGAPHVCFHKQIPQRVRNWVSVFEEAYPTPESLRADVGVTILSYSFDKFGRAVLFIDPLEVGSISGVNPIEEALSEATGERVKVIVNSARNQIVMGLRASDDLKVVELDSASTQSFIALLLSLLLISLL